MTEEELEQFKSRRRRRALQRENSETQKEEKRDLGLKITIHRGTDQIGGSVTEYKHGGWRLFVDYGEPLQGSPNSGPLQIEGLTYGDISKSALLITHYHGDHIGCITELSESLPVYMSAVGRDIQQYASEHLSSVNEKQKRMAERLKQVSTFTPGTEFSFGPFTVMPIVMDHSAFDASAFKIKADGISVFHTGDFRTHGFRSGTLPKVIEKFIGTVNYVVCEGTNVARPDATSKSERELQNEYEEAFREHKNNVVYLSSTNIDRLFALYHAAAKAGRPFIVSAYQKKIMDTVIGRDPIWGKSRMYRYSEQYEPLALQYEQDEEIRVSDKFQYLLEQKGCVMIAQVSDRFDRLIQRLQGDTRKYLSMWQGYVQEGSGAYNPRLAQSLGDDYQYMHTSGHCDMKSVRELFSMLRPCAIIPIHTDKPDDFAQLFSDRWPVIRLHDGETLSPISSRVMDAYSAHIITAERYDQTDTVSSREDDAVCYGLEKGFIGDFRTAEDAKFAIDRTVYRSDYVLGYEVMEEEDMWPSKVHIYDADRNLLSSYLYGGHNPKGPHYQEPTRFCKGEKVLAVFQGGREAIIPSELLGPISPEYIRENFEQTEEDYKHPKTFKEYQELWSEWLDWDWDQVAVHPLVKLNTSLPMVDTELVPRIYIFPYREFKFPEKEDASGSDNTE